MNKLINFIKKYLDFIIYLFLIIIVLSPYIYTNGYFLGIDYISGPNINFIDGQYYPNYFLYMYIQKIISFFIGNIITQKIFILGFFIISFFSSKTLFKNFSDNKIVIFLSIIFFVFNPFVYPRLLQGQFFILYAYSIFPLIYHFLLKKNYIFLSIISAIIISFSPHFLFIIFLFVLFYFLFNKKEFLENINFKNFFLGIFIIYIFNIYWIFDIFSKTNFSNFGNDFLNFSSKNVYFQNIYFEIFSLNGFWGDYFSRYYIKINFFNYFYIISLVFFIFSGLFAVKKEKNKLLFFCSIFLSSFILSIGVSENNIFKNLNFFIFENIPFYSGLRETNKFSAILALIYSILILKGVEFLKSKININLLFLPILFIIFTTWNINLIIYNQIKGYKYPLEWEKAKEIINNEKSIFLPRHQSMSFNFSEKKVIMNPGSLFFGKNMIVGDNIEIGNIYSQSNRKESIKLDKYFKEIKNGINELIFLKDLKKLEIKYILLSKNLEYKIYEKYLKILEEKNFLEKKIDSKRIILYKIKYTK